MIFLAASWQCLRLKAAFTGSDYTAGSRACLKSRASGWVAVGTPRKFDRSNLSKQRRRRREVHYSRNGRAPGFPSYAPGVASTASRDPD